MLLQVLGLQLSKYSLHDHDVLVTHFEGVHSQKVPWETTEESVLWSALSHVNFSSPQFPYQNERIGLGLPNPYFSVSSLLGQWGICNCWTNREREVLSGHPRPGAGLVGLHMFCLLIFTCKPGFNQGKSIAVVAQWSLDSNPHLRNFKAFSSRVLRENRRPAKQIETQQILSSV